MDENSTVVIVGASLAGAKAAETLRSEGFTGNIVLLGEESERPYERPPLSKEYLMGKAERADAYVHDEGWYAEQHVDLRTSTKVTGLDTGNSTVTTEAGETISYDALLITTGSDVTALDVPGADLAGVHYLRRLDESDALREKLKKGVRVVVVGAGWIGMEVAAAAREAGADVTVVEQADLPLQGVLGDEVARIYADLHREHGVDLRQSTSVREIRGDTSVSEVVLEDGATVPADLVVVGIGVTPATALAEAGGLDLDGGICVDQALRTSAEGVWAAGDVAAAFHPLYGKRIHLQHWDNASNGGPAAARSILGQEVVYDAVPYFFSDQYDLGMELAGLVEPGAYDDVVFRGDGAEREFVTFWLADGRVVAGMNANIWDVNDDIKALVRSGKQVDRTKLADPSVPLSDL